MTTTTHSVSARNLVSSFEVAAWLAVLWYRIYRITAVFFPKAPPSAILHQIIRKLRHWQITPPVKVCIANGARVCIIEAGNELIRARNECQQEGGYGFRGWETLHELSASQVRGATFPGGVGSPKMPTD
jgi:hypothetical protein